MDTDTIKDASTVLAALELLPAEPRDLTAILRDPDERAALLGVRPSSGLSPLVTYLVENLDLGRVDHWFKAVDRLHQVGSAIALVAGTPEYPAKLAECWDAPPLLFATGAVPTGSALAIVGSRSAPDDVLVTTRSLAADLASRGLVVVSGLAAGVDAAAHRGALDVGGTTIAVMGTGIDRVFPEENIDLAEQIRESGTVLSQFAPSAPRTGTTFLRRNSVIAALTDVSLVMDGRERSGSRHEIEQAIAFGRSALMWAPSLASEDWAQDLANRGLASFVSSVEQVVAKIERSN
ncbi:MULTISPECIES: DNA-processing protein DprA [Rhodococcus]|uniref:DNA-protecting protein DprA n=1 Tax=Rhodococcus qingshengii JCM 15477 TaxID=1303681 RepID=A0AB38R6D2_RHOSG|nr:MULTISPECIES: DNA-processing protein DprA [Rhodococcus]MCD2131399.1 DNA-protecting protein DprA [Rhodococcus qingshengii]UPU40818.1 DNA-protecting protein DprA [Rhodococcus qingshengii JCM 15477]